MELEVKGQDLYCDGKKRKKEVGLCYDTTNNGILDYKLKKGYKQFVFNQEKLSNETIENIVNFQNKNDLTLIRLCNYIPGEWGFKHELKGAKFKPVEWGFNFDFKNFFEIINKINEYRLDNKKQPIITIVPFANRWLVIENEKFKERYETQAKNILSKLEKATTGKLCPVIIELANEPYNEHMKPPKKIINHLYDLVPDKYPTMYVTHALDSGLKEVECDIRGLNLYPFLMTLEWKELSSAGFRERIVRSNNGGFTEKLLNNALWFITRYAFPLAGKIALKIGEENSNFLYESMLERFLDIETEKNSIKDKIADAIAGMIIKKGGEKKPSILTETPGCRFIYRPYFEKIKKPQYMERPVTLQQVLGLIEESKIILKVGKLVDGYLGCTYQSIEELFDLKTGKVWNKWLAIFLKDFSLAKSLQST